MYRRTSSRLLKILDTRFDLKLHLDALKRFILLSQGDFVRHLMDSLGPSLSNPAAELHRHNLTSALESSIRMSSQKGDVLARLDARITKVRL